MTENTKILRLGKRQVTIIILLVISSTIFYYTNILIENGGGFSEGIVVGFLLGLIFLISLTIIFLWLQMIYLNIKVRWKKEK